MPITNQDRAAIRKIFAKVKAEVEPLLAAKRAELGAQPAPFEMIAKVMYAQNALRVCMEVVLDENLPYDEFFCGELAVRLAAYAISATPIERHDALVEAVAAALPATLDRKRRDGAVIKADWITDGVEHPNIPEKKDVN